MLKCLCGFEGGPRTHIIKSSIYTRCPGCDQFYRMEDGHWHEFTINQANFSSVSDIQHFTAAFQSTQLAEAVADKPSLNKKTAKRQTTKRKPRAKRGKVESDEAISIKSKVNPNDVYYTMHIYTRPGDTFPATLHSSKVERNARADSIVIFAHDHPFKKDCSAACREVIE